MLMTLYARILLLFYVTCDENKGSSLFCSVQLSRNAHTITHTHTHTQKSHILTCAHKRSHT